MFDRVEVEDMENVYDAHIHFPIKMAHPYEKLKEEIRDSRINGATIILNSDEEKAIFWENAEFIEHGDLNILTNIVFLIDVHTDKWKDEIERIDKRGWHYSIKFHPRLNNIKVEDFNNVADIVKCIPGKTIIVDNWLYGPRIINHIGTELSIYLAEKFPDKNIVMAHAGGLKVLEAMLLTRPLENIYFDLSNTCKYFIDTSVQADIIHFIKYTNDKIMFGSDYPEFSINSSIKSIKKEMVDADIGDEEMCNILSRTAIKIFGEGIKKESNK